MARFVISISILLLLAVLITQAEAHVDNAKFMLQNWLSAGPYDYNSDGKTNVIDFTIDTHPGRPDPTPGNSPFPSPDATWPNLRFVQFITGLSSPLHVTHAGDGSGRLFVLEQGGKIRLVKNGVLVPTPFLDVSSLVSCCGERGLLGLAFPPNYASKGYFYINYTNTAGHTTIARFRLSGNPDIANINSQEIFLTVTQPFANHNGGSLTFGPDGYLYIGMGDGGSAGDPQNRAQNPNELLGKMLRIDVESGVSPYGIPPDNPFVGRSGYRPEIWSMGMRNPWRFSFDRASGDLYIADVGQSAWEEINYQSRQSLGGENYGWRIMEGTHCYNPATGCDQTGLTLPVTEFDHSFGCSVTGGYVYRGLEFGLMQGVYFYSDYCSGRVWGLRQANGGWQSRELVDTAYAVSSFGEDEAGRLYITDYTNGVVYRVEDTGN